MATGKEIKRRIKSVKSTKKITKAMELVAASKMKKAVNKTLDSRVYAGYSWNILRSLLSQQTEEGSISQKNNENVALKAKELVVLISSNRGLCGAYNAQVIRSVIKHVQENSNQVVDFVTIGRKGDVALRRTGQNIIANFDIGENVTVSDVMPIVDFLVMKYGEDIYDRVSIQYTDYVSALSQKPNRKQLLPFDVSADLENETQEPVNLEFKFEPSFETIVPILKDKIMRVWVYQMLLESLASEQSARMMAMRNASDAAGEMIDSLTLIFNKARQTSITKEISEISAGMASVS
jgi:F-type H+-transporting ATPase subunit gamma